MVLLLAVLASSMLVRTAPGEDWSNSAEAAFLTTEERHEWKALHTDESREEFKKLYWSRRDPNPLTETNEFREIPNDAFATPEFHTWIYDRDTRADLLGILGASHVEIPFIVEPGHRDELQQPGRFHEWQEIVARA